MIELRNVTKEYSKGNSALNGVSVKIERGEFVFIVGDSGSGKSTLIRLIMKELNPTEGTIIVNGQNLNRMKHRNIAKYRRGLGVVFQDFRLLRDRNIYENIAFALRVTETPTKVIKKKVPAALSLVGLAQKYKSFPKELSGGEQQRVAIARAIVNEPAILLADEPTGNLDAHNSMEIMGLLEQINRRGTTVVVVTHSHEIVERMGKRVITIDRGTVISDEVMPPWDYGELQVDELHTRHGESGQDLGWYGGNGSVVLPEREEDEVWDQTSRESGSEKTVPFHELSKRRKRGRKRGKQG